MNLARNILESDISIRVETNGSSMRPFIRAADYVTIKPVQAHELKVGDILAYSCNGRDVIICHRLVKIEGLWLILKGDNHYKGYERIAPDSLLGKVVFVERGGNKISLERGLQKAMATKISWLSFNIPLLLWIFIYIIEVIRAPRLVLKRIIRKLRR